MQFKHILTAAAVMLSIKAVAVSKCLNFIVYRFKDFKISKFQI